MSIIMDTIMNIEEDVDTIIMDDRSYCLFYFALLEDEKLTLRQAVLYSVIENLAKNTGYCYALDETFAEMFRTSKPRIQADLKALEDEGYIKRVTRWHPSGRCERRIFIRKTGRNLKLDGTEETVKTEPKESAETKKDKPNNYAQECDEIIDYLNSVASKKYRHTENNRKHIRARLNEGFNLDECKKVIDVKCAEWKGTEREKYLRPETLFGNKFESYLNQAPKKETKPFAYNTKTYEDDYSEPEF